MSISVSLLPVILSGLLRPTAAQTEPHCCQGVPRSAHVGKWGNPRLRQLLVGGCGVGEIDNARILVVAYMHDIGSPRHLAAGCFYRPMILIIMWGPSSLAVFPPRIHSYNYNPITCRHR